MANWLNKLLGKGPKPYEPVSSQVKFLDQYSGDIEHTIPIVVTPPRQQYIIKSEGKYYVYNTKEEMSDELRAEIEHLDKIDKISSYYTVIRNGKREIFSRFEEIPAEIQAAIKDSQP